jgi:steroid delta-isomerase-like uncharacterized protein
MLAQAKPADPELRARREAIVLAHIDAENAKDVEAALQTFARPCYEIVATEEVIVGEEQVRALISSFTQALPNVSHVLETLHHADDAVIVEFRSVGTHDGEWAGIPATGARIDARAVAIFVFDGDQLVCERIYRDTASLERQLRGTGTPA